MAKKRKAKKVKRKPKKEEDNKVFFKYAPYKNKERIFFILLPEFY